MHIQDIQSGENAISNLGTYRNYVSILNAVNKHFKWDYDVVHYDKMNEHAEDIAKFIYSHYKISNTDHYTTKMATLSSWMTRTGYGKDHKLATMVQNSGKFLSVMDKSNQSTIESWEVLQPKLQALGKHSTICGIIARIFSYGYVLRVGEMFNTRIDKLTPEDNYLDLDKCIWHIGHQKNGKAKQFDVDKSLCDSLKYLQGRTWLLSMPNGSKYSRSASRLTYHHWPLPSNSDLRKSYETWNKHQSGRTSEQVDHWSYILGHSRRTVSAYYDTTVKPVQVQDPRPRVKVTKKDTRIKVKVTKRT